MKWNISLILTSTILIYMSYIIINSFCHQYIINHIVSSSTIIAALNEKWSKQCPGWTPGSLQVNLLLTACPALRSDLIAQGNLKHCQPLWAVCYTVWLSSGRTTPHFPCIWPKYLYNFLLWFSAFPYSLLYLSLEDFSSFHHLRKGNFCKQYCAGFVWSKLSS